MQFTMYRSLVAGAILIPCVAAGVLAQPPASLSTTDKLKTDTAALAAERAAAESTSAERAKLQADLRRLLDRIDKAPVGPAPGPMIPPTSPTPKTKDDGTVGASVDQLRAATNLAQDNQIESALKAFQLIDPARLAPADRAFARFMTASCLRRLGRMTEALPIYREVGDGGEEPFIASSAVSQVALIRTSEELQAQLTQLRARTKSR